MRRRYVKLENNVCNQLFKVIDMTCENIPCSHHDKFLNLGLHDPQSGKVKAHGFW